MRSSVLVGYILVALAIVSPGAANAACGEECDGQYASDIDDCRSQFGDDPRDADDLANCIQEARGDYRSCVEDCANGASFTPPSRLVVEGAPVALAVAAWGMPTRSLVTKPGGVLWLLFDRLGGRPRCDKLDRMPKATCLRP